MESNTALLTITAAACIINFAISFIAFPTRYGKRLSIAVVALYIIAYLAATYLFLENFDRPSKYLDYLGFMSLIVLLYFFRGLALQKVFMLLVLGMLSVCMSVFSRMLVGLFIPSENGSYILAHLIVTMFFYSVYFIVFIKSGRQFFNKLFSHGSNIDWAIYTSWAMFALCIFMFLRQMPGSTVLYIALYIFVPFNLGILLYAIIITNYRRLSEHERDLAREIFSSGRSYYNKLTDMTENLHRIRHDYKYQLNTIQKMLEVGQSEEAKGYLVKLSTVTKGAAIQNYCTNHVLNALLNNFAEHCETDDISFTAKIILPPPETIDDYELCVIVGNLLENAITACLRTPESRKRYVNLSMRSHEDSYGINVENSFDGALEHEGKVLFSTKKGGGLGINSIKSVAKLHNGEYVPVWDDEKFSAFVVLKLEL
jgi:signal transduction histidine kinase